MADLKAEWASRRRATIWGAVAAAVMVALTAGAVGEGAVALGAAAAFAFVHYGLLEFGAAPPPAPEAPPAAPLRAAAMEHAALGATTPAKALAPAAAPAPAVAAPAPVPAPAVEAAPAPTTDAAPAPTTDAAPAPTTDAAPAPTRPALHATAPARASDDLKRIKGIGPKLETLLNTMGVHHFDQIAGWTAAEVAWIDGHLEGFKGRATRDGWVAQAQILAVGGATEFSGRVDAGDVPSSQG